MNKKSAKPSLDEPTGMRLDKWLWAARFCKTRALAVEMIERGRVLVNDQAVKASREVRVGDTVSLRQADAPVPRVVEVRGLSSLRGPAPVAQQLYAETEASLLAREEWRTRRHYAAEPAQAIEHGRPTKQDRRQLDELQRAPWQRWSASLDDDEDGA